MAIDEAIPREWREEMDGIDSMRIVLKIKRWERVKVKVAAELEEVELLSAKPLWGPTLGLAFLPFYSERTEKRDCPHAPRYPD